MTDVEIMQHFAETDTKLARVEARATSNTRRLDDLQKLAEGIHEQGKTLAIMCKTLEQQNKTLEKQDARLAALEAKPADRWEKALQATIAAVVGLIIGAVAAAMKLGV